MSTKDNKKLDLDFNLDEDNHNSKTGVDFLLNNVSESKTQSDARVELAKSQIQSYSNNTDEIVTIDPTRLSSLAAHLKAKQSKDVRLQTYITSETSQAINQWKRSYGIKKDSDAIEALLRLALGLKQI